MPKLNLIYFKAGMFLNKCGFIQRHAFQQLRHYKLAANSKIIMNIKATVATNTGTECQMLDIK